MPPQRAPYRRRRANNAAPFFFSRKCLFQRNRGEENVEIEDLRDARQPPLMPPRHYLFCRQTTATKQPAFAAQQTTAPVTPPVQCFSTPLRHADAHATRADGAIYEYICFHDTHQLSHAIERHHGRHADRAHAGMVVPSFVLLPFRHVTRLSFAKQNRDDVERPYAPMPLHGCICHPRDTRRYAGARTPLPDYNSGWREMILLLRRF